MFYKRAWLKSQTSHILQIARWVLIIGDQNEEKSVYYPNINPVKIIMLENAEF